MGKYIYWGYTVFYCIVLGMKQGLGKTDTWRRENVYIKFLGCVQGVTLIVHYKIKKKDAYYALHSWGHEHISVNFETTCGQYENYRIPKMTYVCSQREREREKGIQGWQM